MKTRTLKAMGFIFLFVLALSCQQEVPENEVSNKVSGRDQAAEINTSNMRIGSHTLCLFDIIQGLRLPPFGCRSIRNYICSMKVGRCFTAPDLFWRFPCNPKCPGPIDIFNQIDPVEFIIPNEFGPIDRVKNFAIYPINARTVVFQFYAPIKGIIDQKTFELKSGLPLAEETVKEFALEGKVIAPGKKFPVVFNPQNKTYNAIVSVDSYPLNYSSPVAQIIAPNFNGSLNDLFGNYSLQQHPQAVLQESESQKFQISPFYQQGKKGTYLFSPDKESLGIIFYGEPKPSISIKGSIFLKEEIAAALGITPFELKAENLNQGIDPQTGALTVLITR
jgi:hypothetical protein